MKLYKYTTFKHTTFLNILHFEKKKKKWRECSNNIYKPSMIAYSLIPSWRREIHT